MWVWWHGCPEGKKWAETRALASGTLQEGPVKDSEKGKLRNGGSERNIYCRSQKVHSRKKVVIYKRNQGQQSVPPIPGIWMETSKARQRVALRPPLSHSCSSRPTWTPRCMRSLPTQGSTALLKKRPRPGLHRLCILLPLHGHERPLTANAKTASEAVPREETENHGVCILLYIWAFHTKTQLWVHSTLWLYIELYILFWVRVSWTQNACLWFHMQ